jgi:hypothetical protein
VSKLEGPLGTLMLRQRRADANCRAGSFDPKREFSTSSRIRKWRQLAWCLAERAPTWNG